MLSTVYTFPHGMKLTVRLLSGRCSLLYFRSFVIVTRSDGVKIFNFPPLQYLYSSVYAINKLFGKALIRGIVSKENLLADAQGLLSKGLNFACMLVPYREFRAEDHLTLNVVM